MRTSPIRLLALGLLAACANDSSTRRDLRELRAPPTRKVEQVDDYHGVKVADPYRWLEDQDGAETAAWVATQNQVARRFLDALPERSAIQQRLAAVWNQRRWTPPSKHGPWWIYRRNDGLQNQAVIWRTADLREDGEVLLDPNTLSADGTVAVGAFIPSEDGALAAYSIAGAGSDWQEWRVLDVATGKTRTDVLRWCKFSTAAWTHDHQGFFYTRYPAPQAGETYEAITEKPQLCYHRLGTDQADDQVVYERPDQPRWGIGGVVTDDGRYLVIVLTEGTDPRNRLAYLDLNDQAGGVKPLLMQRDASYNPVGVQGERLLVLTDKDAPRSRLVAIDFTRPEPEHWTEVVPQGADTLSSVSAVGDKLVVTWMRDAHDVVEIRDLGGKLERSLDLPGLASVSGFSGRPQDRQTFFSMTSFLSPPSILGFDFDRQELWTWRAPAAGLDIKQFEQKQVFYQSKDGTRVPLFLVHRRGASLDGSHPTLLYGYGGFNNALQPGWSPEVAVFVERGGVYAQAGLRGGNEYGEPWHQDGMLDRKQNVFDDFIAAAEYLVRNGYTSPRHLAIRGGSNGGLLVAACMIQRPELFGAVIPQVGVLDMLRYHRFTIGWAWVPEYGSSDDPEQCKTLLAYSPLHNVKQGTRYPPTLIMTGDHDDRVLPGHSFKFAATLQVAQGSDAPVLLRVERRAGHGGGTPTSKQIEQAADRLAFLSWALGEARGL